MLKTLIVDDDGIERRGIAMLIRRYALPYETSDAANGSDALELLKLQRFDMLITDIRMPFMDGLQLAHEARALYPEMYIVILSAYADFQNAQQAMRENVYRYLLKPVNVQEFVQVMREAAMHIEKGREDSVRVAQMEQEILHYRRQSFAETLSQQYASEAAEESESQPQSVSHAIEQALWIIHEEYGQHLSLAGVAERLHLNPSYFSALFRRQTGESFVRHLNNFRLKKAAEALTDSNLSVGEICRKVGFTGDSYFIMLFRECYGCTPQQYRSTKNRQGGERS